MYSLHMYNIKRIQRKLYIFLYSDAKKEKLLLKNENVCTKPQKQNSGVHNSTKWKREARRKKNIYENDVWKCLP